WAVFARGGVDAGAQGLRRQPAAVARVADVQVAVALRIVAPSRAQDEKSLVGCDHGLEIELVGTVDQRAEGLGRRETVTVTTRAPDVDNRGAARAIRSEVQRAVRGLRREVGAPVAVDRRAKVLGIAPALGRPLEAPDVIFAAGGDPFPRPVGNEVE